MDKDTMIYKSIDGFSIIALLYIIFGSVTSIRICAFICWAMLIGLFIICKTDDKKQ